MGSYPADTLAECDKNSMPEPSIAEIRVISDNNSQESTRLQELRECTVEDEEYQQLKEIILKGFPEHRSLLPESCKKYWQARNHLTLDEELIVHGCRLMIPAAMRKNVLKQLHKAHHGIVRTKQRARLSLYWPGMDNDIKNMVQLAASARTTSHLTTRNQCSPSPNQQGPFRKPQLICVIMQEDIT